LDLSSNNSGCARLGSGVAPPLGVVEKEVAVLVVLVRRHRRAVGAAVRRAVDDEVPGAVEEGAGPAAVRRVPPGLLDVLPVHALGALGIVVVVRDSCAMMSQMRLTSSDISANAPATKTSTRPPLYLLGAVAIGPSEPGGWPLSSSALAERLG